MCCDIWGSHNDAAEYPSFLEYYAMSSGYKLLPFQKIQHIHLQSQAAQEEKPTILDFFILKIKKLPSFKNMTSRQSTLCNIPDDFLYVHCKTWTKWTFSENDSL